MREVIEFRIPEQRAKAFLRSDQGKRLGDSVRKVTVPISHPLVSEICAADREVRRTEGGAAFTYWNIIRSYSDRELESATMLQLIITRYFEPPGELCGTEYDDSLACEFCGANRTQASPLTLDLRRVPKKADIAATIAQDEWIVSQRLAEITLGAKMTGLDFAPIRHKSRYDDEPIHLHEYPSGRQLLREAEAAGAPYPTGLFWVWVNRPEQTALVGQVRLEHAEAARADPIDTWPLRAWHQLLLTSPPVSTVPPTRFGNSPCDSDHEDQHRCPLGHTRGLNLLSEIFVDSREWDGSDIIRTSDYVGALRGIVRPRPLILVSQRLWRLLRTWRLTGWKAEVAHLV